MSTVNPTATSPADVYEEAFVPALFQQWGEVVSTMASVGPGDRVLDVACGTGAAARAAAARTGPNGAVTGLDPNPDMLGVARRKNPTIEWREGKGERLPYADDSFDAVLSQFGLMFFEDKAVGLREMMRVLRPGGAMAIAVCDALDHSPGYSVLAELLQRLFGVDIADAFRAPFVLGDVEQLRALCMEAGIPNAEVTRRDGTVRFGSISDLVSTERACVWTLGGLLSDADFARLDREARVSLQPFQKDGGRIAFTMPALIITAQKQDR